jgi:hypothetical protein
MLPKRIPLLLGAATDYVIRLLKEAAAAVLVIVQLLMIQIYVARTDTHTTGAAMDYATRLHVTNSTRARLVTVEQ